MAYRYLILMFPGTERTHFCELEVYVSRKFLYRCSIHYHVVLLAVTWELQKQHGFNRICIRCELLVGKQQYGSRSAVPILDPIRNVLRRNVKTIISYH